LLVHICCAPCACLPVRSLREEGYRIKAFFYNPNIHPFREYQRRRDAVAKWAEHEAVAVTYASGYQLEEFLQGAVPTHQAGERCRYCYQLRLDAAAAQAAAAGCPVFTTSLLISPYQKHDLIKELGQESAARHGVEFLYRDLRPLWRAGVALSKELDLYRQPYCGCIYSEKERYWRPGC